MRKIGLQVIVVLSLLVVSLSFLTAKVNGEVRFSDLNENEVYYNSVMELVNVLSSDYCKTNEIEYFAEAFSAYFTHPVLMQKRCPKTYIFIKDICDILEEKYK